jgi:hypothetical protein
MPSSMCRSLCASFVMSAALVALSQTGDAQGGEPTKGMPKCEEFFTKWEVPGAPAGILAMAGFAREVMAARDCLKQNNVAKACQHWGKLLEAMDKLGPPLDENRNDIKELMRQNKC